MNWDRIENSISLHDPLTGFHFAFGDDAEMIFRFRDWQNRRVTIRFQDVTHFSFGYLRPDPECADGEFYRRSESSLINRVRGNGVLGPEESAYHYLIGSSEDQWCEIIASSHQVEVSSG